MNKVWFSYFCMSLSLWCMEKEELFNEKFNLIEMVDNSSCSEAVEIPSLDNSLLLRICKKKACVGDYHIFNVQLLKQDKKLVNNDIQAKRFIDGGFSPSKTTIFFSFLNPSGSIILDSGYMEKGIYWPLTYLITAEELEKLNMHKIHTVVASDRNKDSVTVALADQDSIITCRNVGQFFSMPARVFKRSKDFPAIKKICFTLSNNLEISFDDNSVQEIELSKLEKANVLQSQEIPKPMQHKKKKFWSTVFLSLFQRMGLK